MTAACAVCIGCVLLLQVRCDNGTVLSVTDDMIYSAREKLPRSIRGKVKVCT